MFFMDSLFTPHVAFQSRLFARPNIRQNKVSASPSAHLLHKAWTTIEAPASMAGSFIVFALNSFEMLLWKDNGIILSESNRSYMLI